MLEERYGCQELQILLANSEHIQGEPIKLT